MSAVESVMTQPQQAPARIWRGLDLVLMTVLSVVVFIIGVTALVAALLAASDIGGAADMQTRAQALTKSLPFSVGAALLSTVSLVGVVLAGKLWRGLSWQAIGLRSLSRRGLLLAAGVAVALRLFAIPLSYLLQALGFPMENPQLDFLAPEGFTWPAALAMTVLAGVAVPFAEELFFRGVLYTWLRDRWGVWVGVVVSALVFGVIHGQPTVAVIAFFLGLATAWIFERTKSLWASVAVHVVFNTLAIVMLYAALAAGMELPGMS